MAHIKIPKRWQIPEREATPEHIALEFSRDRRNFLARFASAALVGAAALGCATRRLMAGPAIASGDGPHPARRNIKYTLYRPITDEQYSIRYNNFFEFSSQKDVWRYVDEFQTEPWML